ncbi:MAG: AI-2E family transporter [Tissierellia bacterium]|nr:AI-2E family transporter [Tissierellia bacterium]
MKKKNNHHLMISESTLIRTILIGITFYVLLDRLPKIWEGLLYIFRISSPFLTGLALAFIVNFPMTKIEAGIEKTIESEKILKYKRAIALILSYLLVIGVVAIMIAIVLPQLLRSLSSLNYKLPVFIQSVLDELKNYSFLRKQVLQLEESLDRLNLTDVYVYLETFFQTGATDLFKNTLTTIGSLTNRFMNSLFSLVFSIYALAGKEELAKNSKKLMYAVLPEKTSDKINHVFSVMYRCFFSFIGTRIIDAFIVGIITFVLMTLLRLPYIPMLSVLVGFTNVVPIVGPFIGGFIGVIFMFLVSPSKALIFALMIIVIQQIDGNIIFPKLAGSSLNLPGIWTLFAVTMGAALLGIVGVLLFVPLASVIYELTEEYTHRKIFEKRINLKEK